MKGGIMITEKDIEEKKITEITEDLNQYAKYGDFVYEYKTNMPIIGYNDRIVALRKIRDEQIINSLNEIYKLRKEEPLFIFRWEDQTKNNLLEFGWYAWTNGRPY
jgi:hypothetical protein